MDLGAPPVEAGLVGDSNGGDRVGHALSSMG